MSHGPKILCIHLQRAFTNRFGELVKLQGHVSFPLILSMSPFVRSGVGIQNRKEILRDGQMEHCQSLHSILNPLNIQLSKGIRNDLNLQIGNKNPLNLMSTEEVQPEACLDAAFSPNKAAAGTGNLATSEEDKYRLVAVVEHFGRPGSGHYIVYRRVNAELNDSDPVQLLESSPTCWFCISDSQVNISSEHDVLNAEASMLFYEKI